MGHAIQAFVSRTELLQSGLKHLRNVHVIDLVHGFSLVPVTDELHDEVATGGRTKSFEEFWKLSPELEQLGITLSKRGAVAYIETEYFGGVGEQAAILWEHGAVVFGPLIGERGAINAVLRRMGVDGSQAFDEFEALGLHRYRSNEAWIEQPRYGKPE